MENLIPIVLFMCVAGVLILRPVTKKLGLLIEAMAKERLGSADRRPEEPHLSRVAASLDQLNSRLDLLDDRINFVERLVETRPRHQRLTG